jgi:hypothetical protein
MGVRKLNARAWLAPRMKIEVSFRRTPIERLEPSKKTKEDQGDK